jgi:hypothetical protein
VLPAARTSADRVPGAGRLTDEHRLAEALIACGGLTTAKAYSDPGLSARRPS